MPSAQQNRILTEHEVRGLMKDPAYSWRWALVLPDIRGRAIEVQGASGAGSFQSPGLSYAVGVPVALALSVNFAPDDLGVDQRPGGGGVIHVPRHNHPAPVSVTLYENYRYDATKYLQAWKREIVDADERGINNFGIPSEFKKPITFLGFDITSNTKSIIQVQGIDCFPNPPSGLDYGVENSLITVSTEFNVDKLNYFFTRA